MKAQGRPACGGRWRLVQVVESAGWLVVVTSALHSLGQANRIDSTSQPRAPMPPAQSSNRCLSTIPLLNRGTVSTLRGIQLHEVGGEFENDHRAVSRPSKRQ